MAAEDLMLVGSIAYDSAEEAFRKMAGNLGEHMCYLPDGEVGERQSWIAHLAYRVYMGHPDIETLARPLDKDGVEAWQTSPENRPEWRFRVRDGVERVRFGEPGWRLGYARDAINSYFIFRTLKAEGVIPQQIRFQICIPFVSSCVRLYFRDPADYPKIEPAIAAALKAEIETIFAHLPPDDIAIQWDCAIEDTVIETELAADGGIVTDRVRAVAETLFAPAAEINAAIPEAAHLGYHACYGTSGGWPRRSPQDLTGVVLLVNAAVAQSGRRVDFVHLPTVNSESPDYFAPLAALDAKGARVYVGLIHALHGPGGMGQQMDWLRQYLPDFGIAAPCGFGRGPGKMSAQTGLDSPNAYMEGLIEDHKAAIGVLHAHNAT